MLIRNPNEIQNIKNIHPRVVELYSQSFFKQGTAEWLEQRRSFLTASDVAGVLGNCVFKDRKAVYGQKIGTILPEVQTQAMKHGTDNEPTARKLYEQLTGKKVIQFGLLTGSESSYFLAASVDGITTDGVVVEIKCPYSRSIVQGEIPGYYHDQIQTQLEVTNLDVAHYFEYNSTSGDTNLVIVKKDPNWMNIQTRRKLWDFWKDVEFHRKTIAERNKTYQPYPVIQEDWSKNMDTFFYKVYMMEYVKATMANTSGEHAEQCRILIRLAHICYNEGLGYYNLAEDTFIEAEKLCQEHNMMYELSMAVVFRSKLYNSIGMKWYGVPLTRTALSYAKSYARNNPNHVDNLFHIAYTEIILGESFLNWVDKVPDPESEHIYKIRALFWIAQAITTVEENNINLTINQDLIDFHNRFGAHIGWDKINVTFNDPTFLSILSDGAY